MNNKLRHCIRDFWALLDDTEALKSAFRAIRSSMTDKWFEHLGILYVGVTRGA